MLWCPCGWRPGRIREQQNLEKGNLVAVCCFVADIDDGTPPGALEGLWGNRAYVLYSSWGSTTEAPRWRVVFPLAVPIPAEEWRGVWERCSYWLLKNHNDRSAKDPSRMYYTPSCPPERLAEAFARSQDGEWLDARTLPPVPEKATGTPKAAPTSGTADVPVTADGDRSEGRPGDDYNASQTHEDIAALLLRWGWRRGADRGDAIDMIRPGKPSDIRSGTIGHVAPGVFYCFTDSAPPLAPGHGYDAFTLYTILEHGGDFKAAAAALAREGYGQPDISLPDAAFDWVSPKKAPEPPETQRFPLTEYGNAERLIRRHGEDLRFCPTRGWYVWNACAWVLDESGEVERRMKATVRKIQCEADALYRRARRENDADRKLGIQKEAAATLAWASKSESNNRIVAAMRLAQSEPGIPVEAGTLDADPLLLNLANGSLELTTGKLRDHARTDLCTKVLPYAYDPKAVCPTWDAFLKRILPEDLGAYLQRAAGYTLTGLTTEQCLWYLWGSGSNGKSTLVIVLQKLFGAYAVHLQSSVITVRPNGMVNDELAHLAGARLAVINELGKNETLAENVVKQITDTDVIRARFLYKNSFQFPQTHKVWIAANPKLYLADTGDGIMRRIKLVPFAVRIPEAEKDLHLLDKLVAELPGILNWALRGLTQYLAFGIQEPDVVRQAVEEYAEENDVWGQFLEDCCTVSGKAKVQPAYLYAAYCQWAERRNERIRSMTVFGKEIKSRFGVTKVSGQQYYTGLALNEGRMD